MDEPLPVPCSALISVNTLVSLESHAVLANRVKRRGGDAEYTDVQCPVDQDGESLADKLHRLKVKRDNLKKKLTEKSKLKRVAEVIAEQSSTEGCQDAAMDNEELIQSLHERQLVDLKLAYRLTGCSLSMVKDDKIRLSFDTSYKGEYFETYYADLDITDSGKTHVLKRHTLPGFFPKKALQKSLDDSVVKFVHTVQGLLQAYITRRQEVMQLQSEYKEMLLGDVETTAACDFVTFCMKETGSLGCAVKVVMVYTDLASVLPTEVEASLPRSLELENEEVTQVVEITGNMAELLKSLLLVQAVEKIMD